MVLISINYLKRILHYSLFIFLIIPPDHPTYNCHYRFDRRMWVVVFEDDMVKVEFIDRLETRIYGNFREVSWLAGHLLFHLVDMILIDMDIPEGMYKSTRFDAEKVRKNMDKERVGSDIERDAEKEVCRTLIELTI